MISFVRRSLTIDLNDILTKLGLSDLYMALLSIGGIVCLYSAE